MKWKTKKAIYSYDKGINILLVTLEEVFSSDPSSSGSNLDGFGMRVILSMMFGSILTVTVEDHIIFSFLAGIALMILNLPILLVALAKHNTYREIPILKKMIQLELIDKDNFRRIEKSYLDKKDYPNTEVFIENHEEEIEHIFHILKNRKKYEPEMIKHAERRVDSIETEISSCINLDETLQDEVVKKKENQIEKEWNAVYNSGSKTTNDNFLNSLIVAPTWAGKCQNSLFINFYLNLKIPSKKISLEIKYGEIYKHSGFPFYLLKENQTENSLEIITFHEYPKGSRLNVLLPAKSAQDYCSKEIILTTELLNELLNEGFTWFHHSEDNATKGITINKAIVSEEVVL